MKMWAIAALALFGATVPAEAQVSGTIETKSYPKTQDGRRIGCSIEFRAAVQDFAYRNGASVMVIGSVGFMNYPGKQAAVTLKVIIHDVSADGQNIDLNTAAPSSISLVGIHDDSNAGAQLSSSLGDSPGSRIAAYNIDGFLEVYERIVGRKELMLLFNRQAGGIDVRVPIDLTVEDLDESGKPVRSNQTVVGFQDCSRKLLDDMEAANPAK